VGVHGPEAGLSPLLRHGHLEMKSRPSGRDLVPAGAAYLAVGITNSAPLPMLSGQRCMTLFCLV
jgi:hypothetical protein